MALYQKYRPQTFSQVHGQNHVTRVLNQALAKEMVSHAYLFTGPRGTGKTTIARLLAKSLMCDSRDQNGDPCLKCPTCLSLSQNQALDLIEMDAASHTSVDDVRDLIEKAQFAPTLSKKKIYIIDEVHMLSKSAFNALLKTLEEPPSHVHFILATTELDKVPETITSRCQRFDFHRLALTDLISKLQFICDSEKIKVDSQVLEMIADRADGAARNAEVLLEQLISENALDPKSAAESLGIIGPQSISTFLDFLDKKKFPEAFDHISALHSSGQNLKIFTKEILRSLHKSLPASVSNPTKLQQTTSLIHTFSQAANQFKTTLVPELPLELAIADLSLLSSNPTPVSIPESQIKTPTPVSEKKPEQPKPQPPIEKSEPPKSTPKPDFSGQIDDSFKLLWLDVLNHSTLSPVLKNSLKTAIPRNLENDKLTLVLHSEFLYSKISDPESTSKIETVISEIFKTPFKITWLCEPQTADKNPAQVSHSFTPPPLPKTTTKLAEEIFA